MSISRSVGERVRFKHALSRLHANVDSLNVALKLAHVGSIGQDCVQALQTTTSEIAAIVARHDAYALAERDGYRREAVCKACDDTHQVVGIDATYMCTACPAPCIRCRASWASAYCAETPCGCDCHEKRKPR